MSSSFDSKFKVLQDKTKAGILVGLKDIVGVGERLDIDVLLSTQPKTFNLFILALDALQKVPRDDITGFYQLSGIHGLPVATWNNVGKRGVGYCAHGTTTFPTWHRAYMALFEQSLFVKCVTIALQYDEPYKSEYLQAAKAFRLPYWDWFRPRGGRVNFPGVVFPHGPGEGSTSYPYDFSAPTVFTEAYLSVRQYPKNNLAELKNPLSSFSFSKERGDLSAQEWDYVLRGQANRLMLNKGRTTRHPYPYIGPDEDYPKDYSWDNSIRMNTILNELRMDATRVLLSMMKSQYHKQYEVFASNGTRDPNLPGANTEAAKTAFGSSGSLESIHGLFHGLCGGLTPGSHMSRVPTAAFDPIFWFHHGNIERLFTIWQGINQEERATNWFVTPGKADEPLVPFIKETSGGQRSYWSSNLVKTSETLGYTYPEVLKSGPQTLSNFTAMYSWSVPAGRGTDRVKPPSNMQPLDLSQSYFFRPPVEDAGEAPISQPIFTSLLSTNVQIPELVAPIAAKRVQIMTATAAPNTGHKSEDIWEWSIYDQVERLALNGSFSILYFVKQEEQRSLYDVQELSAAPDLAGVTYNFAAPVEACDNCGNQAEQALKVENHVAITSQLMDYVENGQLQSLDVEHVRPFLIDRLRWRVVNANGLLVDPRSLAETKGLEIGVVSRHTSSSLPEPEVQTHADIIAAIVGQASAQAGSATAPI